MDINVNIDLLIAILIIAGFSAQRFNTWPDNDGLILSGHPSDYISIKRFILYYLLYFISILIVALALYGVPDLLEINVVRNVLASIGMDSDSKTYTFFSIATLLILNIPFMEAFEKEWRVQLHNWGRIPRDVEELKKSVTKTFRFSPQSQYFEMAAREINIVDMTQQPQFQSVGSKWLECLKNYEVERDGDTIRWRFLRCVLLLVVAKDICSQRILGSTKEAEKKITELSSTVLLLDKSCNNDALIKLEAMSNYFIECICKHVIKCYEKKEARFQALKNIGFNISHQDCIDKSFGKTLIYSFIGAGFCSIVSVGAILMVLVRIDSMSSFDVGRLLSWSAGSFLSLCVAIVVAAMIDTQKKERSSIDAISGSMICLIVSTLAAALYYIIVSDLNVRSEGNPVARIVLAMSFATLSPFVYRAFSYTSFSTKEVVRFSLGQGLMLGCVMAVFQCLVSISFNIDTFAFSSFSQFLTEGGNKMTYMGIIGFGKGLFLGCYVSYLLQRAKRGQMLESLRRQPRVTAEIPMLLPTLNGTVLIKDISKNGLKIETRADIKKGDEIKLGSSVTGDICGLVQWIHKGVGGRLLAGVSLPKDYQRLSSYIRENYGPYYA